MSDFVDTNIFVRLLTQDDPEKAARCLELFQRAQRGEERLATSEAMVAEAVFVLASRRLYAQPRADVASRLGTLLLNNGLQLDHKETIIQALTLYGDSRLYFVDSLGVAHLERERHRGIYSYDRSFDRVPGIHRLEP